MSVINLNKYTLSYKNGTYGGLAGYKDGIVIDDGLWMVKYPKNLANMQGNGIASYSTSPLSEFIGSHIFAILGIPVHETILGERHNKIVVACEDFVSSNEMLMEVRTIKNYTNEQMAEMFDRPFDGTGSSHCVETEELLLHLYYNPILSRVSGIVDRFWEQAIVDILINNNDRNNGNWGILRRTTSGHYTDFLAPVFDNGASFQSKASDDKIARQLEDRCKCELDACATQVAYGKEGHVYSTKQFITDVILQNEDGIRAIKKMVPIIEERLLEIFTLINSIPTTHKLENGDVVYVCTDERKELYKLQIMSRLNNLLKPAYDKVSNNSASIPTLKDIASNI